MRRLLESALKGYLAQAPSLHEQAAGAWPGAGKYGTGCLAMAQVRKYSTMYSWYWHPRTWFQQWGA